MKYEQISQSLTIDNNASNKLDILILTETFGNDKVPDSFHQIPGYDLDMSDWIKKGNLEEVFLSIYKLAIITQTPKRSGKSRG